MATVYKRGEIWFAKWVNPATGKRVARTTGMTKRREAEKEAESMEARDRASIKDRDARQSAYLAILDRAAADAQRGKLDAERLEEHLLEAMRVTNPEYRRVTVRECFAGWLQSVSAGVEGRTAKNYSEAGTAMLKALGKASDRPLAELEKQAIEKAARSLVKPAERGKQRRTRASTANMHLAAFRRALQWGVDHRWIRDNPAKGIKPLPQTDSDERAPFTPAEARALIAAAPSREWKGAILNGAHTGFRFGDVLKLGKDYVDGSRYIIRPGKTIRVKKIVVIPMSQEVKQWVEEQTQTEFFPTLRKISKPELSAQFKEVMAAAGVPDRITLPGGIAAVRSAHSLRHSFTTWLAEADIQADVRRKLTGHASEDVHAIYTHHDEALDKAIATLPGLAG